MKTRKSWREKMANPKLPALVEIPAKMQQRFGKGTMLLPSPPEVESIIQRVPEGSVVTLTEIREKLARKHGADLACPLVTGICVWLTAEAAEEDAAAGSRKVTPYWRVVKADGALNPRFPGGVERHGDRLREEGHRLVVPNRKGGVPRVVLEETRVSSAGASGRRSAAASRGLSGSRAR